MHEPAWEIFIRSYLSGKPFADEENPLQIHIDRHLSGLT
ncbi:MAG: hypothetical protein QOJ15_3801 [Bradyrhizobium sp.]|nr:hypothetical protein [Bradyrhizobium sp.]